MNARITADNVMVAIQAILIVSATAYFIYFRPPPREAPKLDYAKVSQHDAISQGVVTIKTKVQVNGTCWQSWDVGVETTLTLPEGLTLLDGEMISVKTINFTSNLERPITSQHVPVQRKNVASYAFHVPMHLILNEVIEFYAYWNVTSLDAGNYTVSVSAFSDDPHVHPEFRACQHTREIQIMDEYAPVIRRPLVPTGSYSSGLSDEELYVPPGQDIEVRCNVTCSSLVKNVTLYHNASGAWNKNAMTKKSEIEWVGTIPGQPEETLVVFFVQAFTLTRSARTADVRCRFLDLQILELTTKILMAITIMIILVSCGAILALKRRRMIEVL